MTKTCKACGIEKLVSEFHLNNRNKSGPTKYKARCKNCVNNKIFQTICSMTRICNRCQEEKSIYSYGNYKTSSGKMAKRFTCNVCTNQNGVRWNDKNPEKRRENRINKHYNISLKEYNEILSQGCQICGTMEKLCLDHDHNCCPGKISCGQCIRGALCSVHNLAESYLTSTQAYNMMLYIAKWDAIREGVELAS